MVQLNLRPGPDYMSRAALVCRDDFQPVQDGWCDEPREIGASLILARRRHEPLDILWPEVVVFKSDTTRMRTLRYSILALNTSCFHHLHFAISIVHLKFCGCHVCRRLKPLRCTVAYNYLATRVTKIKHVPPANQNLMFWQWNFKVYPPTWERVDVTPQIREGKHGRICKVGRVPLAPVKRYFPVTAPQ